MNGVAVVVRVPDSETLFVAKVVMVRVAGSEVVAVAVPWQSRARTMADEGSQKYTPCRSTMQRVPPTLFSQVRICAGVAVLMLHSDVGYTSVGSALRNAAMNPWFACRPVEAVIR